MSVKKMKIRRSWLLTLGGAGALLLTATNLIGCQQAEDKNVTSFVPGPIIPPQTPSVPTGATGVGTAPVVPGTPLPSPTITIQAPVSAPTIGPVSPPAPVPKITGESPTPSATLPPPPVPVAQVKVEPGAIEFGKGTTIGDTQTLTLTPSVPPQDGSLVLKVETSNPKVVGLSTTAASFVTVVVPPRSSDTPRVVLTRLIPATQEGNATIVVTRDPSTTAVNYPVGSVNALVPVTLLQQDPAPTIVVDPTTVSFAGTEGVGAVKVVNVTLKPKAPIGGQVVLSVSGVPDPFIPGAPFSVSTSTLVFKEGFQGPQSFVVTRQTRDPVNGSITIKLNPALTTATNFATSDINVSIAVTLRPPDPIKLILAKSVESFDCKSNPTKTFPTTEPTVVNQTGAITFSASPPPPIGITLDRTTGVFTINCATVAESSYETILKVTDSGTPPSSATANLRIEIELKTP